MQQGLSRMISAATLSDEYRPETLLPEEKNTMINQELVPKDIAYVEEYLEEFVKKLKAQKSIKKAVPITPYSIARLKKVGAKNFLPRSFRKLNSNHYGNFVWDNFKNEQKRSIKKLASQTTLQQIDIDNKRQLTKINEQKISKFGVYGGWHWEEDIKESHMFYLINDVSKQKITVYYQEHKDLVKLSTNKKNMMDNNVVTIMLEIARNVQRYSNNTQVVNAIGLKQEYDKEIINNLNIHINALNAGVKSAKNIEDQGKTLKINLSGYSSEK